MLKFKEEHAYDKRLEFLPFREIENGEGVIFKHPIRRKAAELCQLFLCCAITTSLSRRQ